jgi:hypothetical protein
MIVMLFRSIEDAINGLGIIREQLGKIRSDYAELMSQLKVNADVEERLARSGFRVGHRVITIHTMPHTINIHIAPHSTWLLNKLGTVNERIDYVINRIDEVRNYLARARGGQSSVIVIIDEENKRTRLVIAP